MNITKLKNISDLIQRSNESAIKSEFKEGVLILKLQKNELYSAFSLLGLLLSALLIYFHNRAPINLEIGLAILAISLLLLYEKQGVNRKLIFDASKNTITVIPSFFAKRWISEYIFKSTGPIAFNELPEVKVGYAYINYQSIYTVYLNRGFFGIPLLEFKNRETAEKIRESISELRLLIMQGNYIFVLLHSYNGKPSDLTSIEDLIKANYSHPTVLKPQIIKSVLSAPKIDELINRLLKDVDDCWVKKKAQLPKNIDPKIILIGHSMGALLARKIYVCACGENADVPLEKGIDAKHIRPWAAHVERIILLAGMNNGWKINIHLNPGKMLMMSLASLFQPVLSIFGKPLIFGLRRGGTFITQLRLQSIKMQNAVKDKGVGNATVIQMLGTVDDLVSPDDNIDLVSGKRFVYMEMPYSGHKNVIDLNEKKKVLRNGEETTIGDLRAEKLLEALTEKPELLKAKEITTAESKMITQDESVTDVVFVIHGIRDEGYWTQKIAQRVVKVAFDLQSKKKDKSGKIILRKFETETSSYGYFPLLHFALPTYRRAKVEWLMEQYSENMAKYPNAEFSYVGHSNGTYLLSKALEEYPACKFSNVLFAGSVVNHNYDWEKMINSNRVKNVYNIAASSDFVVGIFPHAFHYLGYTELGTAGYTGFKQKDADKASPVSGSLQQVVTVPGGHSAAIQEEYWENIAHFIVEGKLETAIKQDERKRFVKINGALAIFFFLLSLAIIYFIGHLIWITSPNGELRIIFMITYLFFVWKIITKF